jgi:ornithine carbamoyltransferase
VFLHQSVIDLARGARVPVINGLSDLHHPCQVLSDCFTLLEHRGRIAGQRVVFVGDGNNMAHSWMDAAALLGFEFVLACPAGYEPDPAITAEAGSHVTIRHDVEEAVRDADVLYTDVWTSMGQEREAAARRRAFRTYQVNERLRRARPARRAGHALPARASRRRSPTRHRRGPQSVGSRPGGETGCTCRRRSWWAVGAGGA